MPVTFEPITESKIDFEPIEKVTRFPMMMPSPIGLPLPFGHADLDLENQDIKDAVDYSEKYDLPAGIAYQALPRIRKIEEKIEKARTHQYSYSTSAFGGYPTISIETKPEDIKKLLSMPERPEPPEVHIDRLGFAVPKGIMRFLERDVGGT